MAQVEPNSGAMLLKVARSAPTPGANGAEQTFAARNGTGSLEAARGSSPVADNGVTLQGEQDIMGNAWTGYCTAQGTCVDTLWDGGDFNGASWSGASWSGASWSGDTWSGLSWT